MSNQEHHRKNLTVNSNDQGRFGGIANSSNSNPSSQGKQRSHSHNSNSSSLHHQRSMNGGGGSGSSAVSSNAKMTNRTSVPQMQQPQNSSSSVGSQAYKIRVKRSFQERVRNSKKLAKEKKAEIDKHGALKKEMKQEYKEQITGHLETLEKQCEDLGPPPAKKEDDAEAYDKHDTTMREYQASFEKSIKDVAEKAKEANRVRNTAGTYKLRKSKMIRGISEQQKKDRIRRIESRFDAFDPRVHRYDRFKKYVDDICNATAEETNNPHAQPQDPQGFVEQQPPRFPRQEEEPLLADPMLQTSLAPQATTQHHLSENTPAHRVSHAAAAANGPTPSHGYAEAVTFESQHGPTGATPQPSGTPMSQRFFTSFKENVDAICNERPAAETNDPHAQSQGSHSSAEQQPPNHHEQPQVSRASVEQQPPLLPPQDEQREMRINRDPTQPSPFDFPTQIPHQTHHQEAHQVPHSSSTQDQRVPAGVARRQSSSRGTQRHGIHRGANMSTPINPRFFTFDTPERGYTAARPNPSEQMMPAAAPRPARVAMVSMAGTPARAHDPATPFTAPHPVAALAPTGVMDSLGGISLEQYDEMSEQAQADLHAGLDERDREEQKQDSEGLRQAIEATTRMFEGSQVQMNASFQENRTKAQKDLQEMLETHRHAQYQRNEENRARFAYRQYVRSTSWKRRGHQQTGQNTPAPISLPDESVYMTPAETPGTPCLETQDLVGSEGQKLTGSVHEQKVDTASGSVDENFGIGNAELDLATVHEEEQEIMSPEMTANLSDPSSLWTAGASAGKPTNGTAAASISEPKSGGSTTLSHTVEVETVLSEEEDDESTAVNSGCNNGLPPTLSHEAAHSLVFDQHQELVDLLVDCSERHDSEVENSPSESEYDREETTAAGAAPARIGVNCGHNGSSEAELETSAGVTNPNVNSEASLEDYLDPNADNEEQGLAIKQYYADQLERHLHNMAEARLQTIKSLEEVSFRRGAGTVARTRTAGSSAWTRSGKAHWVGVEGAVMLHDSKDENTGGDMEAGVATTGLDKEDEGASGLIIGFAEDADMETSMDRFDGAAGIMEGGPTKATAESVEGVPEKPSGKCGKKGCYGTNRFGEPCGQFPSIIAGANPWYCSSHQP